VRIRSIKPEFWRSDDVASLDVFDRLLFIGLWSYVDDSGIGLDQDVAIAADLFAADLSCNPHDTLMHIAGGMQHIAERGCIVRWTVDDPGEKYDGKHLFKIVHWARHQPIARPSQGHKYPKPPAHCMTPSCTLQETPVHGTGEQGNRGTGEQGKTPPTPSAADDQAALVPIATTAVADAPARPKATRTGTRIPDGWEPERSDANLHVESGFNAQWLTEQLDAFRDYWAGCAGAKGRKADWDATWRNWIRRSGSQRRTNGRRAPDWDRMAADLRGGTA